MAANSMSAARRTPLIAAAVTHGGGWGAALWVILGAAAVGFGAAIAIARLETRDFARMARRE